jgi:hypothetical protein
MARTAVKGYVVNRQVAFVPHPAMHGVWIKTHPCVMQVECPRCGSKVAEPCSGVVPRHPASDGTRVTPLGKYASQVCLGRKQAARGRPLLIPPLEIDLRDLPEPLVGSVPCQHCRGQRVVKGHHGRWVDCPECGPCERCAGSRLVPSPRGSGASVPCPICCTSNGAPQDKEPGQDGPI